MLVYDPNTNPLNTNEWAFPVTECFHIAGFALSIGTIVLVDLRLLGIAMLHQAPKEILRDTAPWTLAGMVVMLTSGPIIFSSDPRHYLLNGPFQFKMAALLAAILFNYTVHRKVAMGDSSPALGKLVGLVSLVLWVSVVAGGLFIAFV